ncbi:MAG: methylated-DNA--[protein]-cysteine S-methyltransferase [Opitutaceae bacterium]|jgi:methylated-DNA-[protein]-cysteine S-methyltransferase|nr:methylated-DNA--[protein]-cysteine S-methyltransferase [Opitutaceae bacterium]
MTYYHDTLSTPVGDITATVDENGALAATSFGDFASSPWTPHLTANGNTLTRSPARLAHVCAQIAGYFAGHRRCFELPLAPFTGTEHQRRVWAALCEIPFGETRAYGDLAKKLATSPRAVGRANATNVIPLIVPCHRVIGADGSLTGFAYGVEMKRRLLVHEGVLLVA